MDMIEQARALAQELHKNQVRRESGLPFFNAHLVRVAKMVAANGGDELAVAGAYCHDILEDVGAEHAQEIEAISTGILALVEQLTERGETWEEEKQGYVAGVSNMDERALLISICDKTCNAQDFIAEWKQGKFGKRPTQILWFFNELQGAYGRRDLELERFPDYRGLLWDLSALIGEMQSLYA